ncbi:MAG: MMPL family transporter [Actinomycetota bacterium]
MFERYGRLVAARRRTVLIAWLVLMVTAFAAAGGVADRLDTEFVGSDSFESTQVREELAALGASRDQIAVIVDGIDVDDPVVRAAIEEARAELATVPGAVGVLDPVTTGDDAFVSLDRDAALLVVALENGIDDDDAHAAVDQVELIAEDLGGQDVLLGGQVVVEEEFQEASERDLQRGELFAIPVALVALVFIFGGIRAAGMPVAVALTAVAFSMVVLLLATTFTSVSIFALNVVSMLGIGLGIDYGLLMVSRFREERAAGQDVERAVARTVATAGVTVVFSGLTVAIAMAGLFAFDDPTLRSFGIAGIAVVLLSMATALTLLPALLAAFGRRIRPAKPQADGEGAFYRLARVVQRRALPVVIVVSVALGALALPFLNARFENGDARSLPRSSEAREAALILADRFPSRGADPVQVIADADTDDVGLTTWVAELAADDDVAAVAVTPTTVVGVSVVEVVPSGTAQGDEAQRLVRELRDADPGFEVVVGGVAAEVVDAKAMLAERLPWAIAAIVLATFVLLFLMTGSLAIPVKAVVMNVLSLGASFGALVWIFQDGNLSGLLGFDSVGSIDLYIPVLIFVFAFGLSMDYEVFLLGRVTEIHDQIGDNDRAVALGLQRTGRIITSAALLIVVVFAGFAAGEVLAIKQLGLGMALAVIVDATIVRSLLVPATMRLLGEWNWWAPAPLRRLHERFGLREPSDGGGLDDERTVDRDLVGV